MNALAINDLSLSNDLDREAMGALTGGGSALFYNGTSYGPTQTSYLGSSQRLRGYGWFRGKWARWYDYRKYYKQTRKVVKRYTRIVWS